MISFEVGFGHPFRLDRTETRPSVDSYVEHIKSSIRMIITTDPTERPLCMRNGVPFGTKVRRFLFNSDESALAASAYEVRKALAVWEPRVQVNDVVASIETGPGGIKRVLQLKVFYTIVASNKTDEVLVIVDGGV